MDNLSLNFFGEKVEVKLPETLASLRNKISEKFFFSPSDTAELVLTYAKDLGKKIIETEKDFEEFIKSKVFNIDLDIDKNSQIFKKSLIKLEEETETDKKELENLLMKSQELKSAKEHKILEAKKKMDDLAKKTEEVQKRKKEYIIKCDLEIQKIKAEISNIKKLSETEVKNIGKKEIELNKSINDIKTKLGIPAEKKEKKLKSKKPSPKPKKEEKKTLFDANTLKKIVGKVNDFINKNVEKKENLKQDGKNLLNTIKKVSDIVKANAEKIGKTVSKKYEEYKNIISGENKEVIHWKYICDGCRTNPIKGIRYHCVECNDFDFCEKCYNEKKDIHGHKFKEIEKSEFAEPELKFTPPTFISDKLVHKRVTCDGCETVPIIGCRYKCAICRDFDYCENCEKKNYKKHSHPMIKISTPELELPYSQCTLKEEFKMDENDNSVIIHKGITCDGCGYVNITGNRYKCAVCHNFDFCEQCLEKNASEHKHPFIKIYHPKMELDIIKVIIKPDCPVYNNSNSKKLKGAKKEEKKEDKKEDKKKDNQPPVHEGYICDGCDGPIIGCRYKCSVCKDYNLCEKCEELFSEEHQHPLIKIYRPEMDVSSIKCIFKKDH